MMIIDLFVIAAFSTQCWEVLNGYIMLILSDAMSLTDCAYSKQNMFQDGACQQINQINNTQGVGWRTQEDDDWIYYPQQYGIYLDSTCCQV